MSVFHDFSPTTSLVNVRPHAPFFVLVCCRQAHPEETTLDISGKQIYLGITFQRSPGSIDPSLESHLLSVFRANKPVEFNIEKTVLRADQEVLSQRSEYFRTMFGSGMREEEEGVVIVDGVGVEAFSRILLWIHTSRVNLPDIDSELYQELFSIADRYMVS